MSYYNDKLSRGYLVGFSFVCFDMLPLVSINYELSPTECFNDGATGWRQYPRLTAREIAMLTIMNFITDKKGWEMGIFEEEITAGWREECAILVMMIDEQLTDRFSAREVPVEQLMSDKMWEWCVMELRDKAKLFKEIGFVRVLDSGSCACKSDLLISSTLCKDLQDASTQLWKSGRKERGTPQLVDLVDPSMYPLVYGKTRILKDGKRAGFADCVESCSDSLTIVSPSHVDDQLKAQRFEPVPDVIFSTHARDHPSKWSLRYQWLPCDISLKSTNGGASICSYINNLNPVEFAPLYKAIEQTIAPAIELWNNCLFKGLKAPAPIRIRTYGWGKFQFPDWRADDIYDIMSDYWENKNPSEDGSYVEFLHQVDTFLDLEDDERSITKIPDKLKVEIASRDPKSGFQKDSCLSLCRLVYLKRERLRNHPEPGTAFSYADWCVGINGATIVPSVDTDYNPSIDKYERRPCSTPDQDDGIYTVSLRDTFGNRGLQLIVRLQSLELTPSSPIFKATEFTLEAQRNAHIISSALVVYSADNVTTPHISFRQPTWMAGEDYNFNYHSEDDDYKCMRAVFGFSQSAASELDYEKRSEHRLRMPGSQHLGTISLPTGRVVAWPNTLAQRMESCSLVDPERSGQVSYLVLHLVDPNYVIISTANVPPQQHEWWVKAALETGPFAAGGMAEKLPTEIKDMIDLATGEWPMGKEEAEMVREDIEEERKNALKTVMQNEGWGAYGYDPDISELL